MNDEPARNLTLDAAVKDAEARYVTANPNSEARYQRALRSMPGANTRTVLHYDPFPLALATGEGATVTDLDGHRYRDLLGEYTAGLYGHSEPAIIEALHKALDGGMVLGGPNRYEAELADVMCERFPALEQVRFCNSGTEANMMCLSLARAVSGKPRVMAFHGGYHGGLFSFASGDRSPMNADGDVVLADFNDTAGARATIAEHAGQLAAVVLEPVMGGGGCIAAEPEFLAALREETERHGIILIFDEVMTSRLAPGGMQERTGITPDLAAFGKYLGGGSSFGAFGGRRDLMIRLDPSRADALTHSGTFNNNVLSMTAGLTGLTRVLTPEANRRLNEAGDRLRERMQAAADSRGAAVQVLGVGSMLCVHFQRTPIRRPSDTDDTSPDARKLFQLEMLLAGFYLSRRGFMSLALPLTAEDYDAFVDAFEQFIDAYGAVVEP